MLDLLDWDHEEALRVDCHYLTPCLPLKLSKRLSLLILNFNLIQLRAIGNPILTGMRNKKGLLVEASKAEEIASEPRSTELPSDCWALIILLNCLSDSPIRT